MTETRRPNNRASTEYAPGPRSASASSSSMGMTQTSSRAPKNRLAMATAQAIRDKYGVRKPIVSEMNINEAPVKTKGAEDTPKRLAKLMRKIAATEILRSNN